MKKKENELTVPIKFIKLILNMKMGLLILS